MEDSLYLKLNLRNGGEGVYVTPVSRYITYEDRSKNILRFYPPIEFSPNIPWQLKYQGEEDKWESLKVNMGRGISLLKNVLDCNLSSLDCFFGSNVFHEYFSYQTWDFGLSRYEIHKYLESDWYYAAEVFPFLLHFYGNLEFDFYGVASKYFEDASVKPSSLWVEEKLKDRFHVWADKRINDDEIEKEFYQWKQEQEAKGCEVYYITSLET